VLSSRRLLITKSALDALVESAKAAGAGGEPKPKKQNAKPRRRAAAKS